jgi:signal transduction histidine kinase
MKSKNKMQTWLGESEMSQLVLAKDWSKTPLGPIESWPQSLKTMVSLCLNSEFPIAMIWGPHYVQIYNDGFLPLCGEKHPQALGQNFKECWATTWPFIGDAFDKAFLGESAFLENERMFSERFGYLEETFFTFSFSPIRSENGNIDGLFLPVVEVSEQELSKRRGRILRELVTYAYKAQTVPEAAHLMIKCLAQFPLDLPFSLFYLYEEGKKARLISASDSIANLSICPSTLTEHGSQAHQWPIYNIKDEQIIEVNDLKKRFGSLTCGPYPECIETAMLLPIFSPLQKKTYGVLIVGVSTRRALTESYRSFYAMLQTTANKVINNASAYQEEKQQVDALIEIDRAKTIFFSNISHELRTPLTLLLGMIEETLNDLTNSQENKIRLEMALRNATRLLKLVNTCLDFSRIEAGRMQASFYPTDLPAFTIELASMFQSAIEKAGIHLKIECDSFPELIYVDRSMWEKIVMNLLSNAFKNTFKGTITVKLRWKKDHIELSIQDTGIGIASEYFSKLFERFYRIPNIQSRTHEGTGIGLSLVYELVKFHKGNIDVSSVVNKGSTFTVSIPTGKNHLPPNQIEKESSIAFPTLSAQPFVQEALDCLPDTTKSINKARNSSKNQSLNESRSSILIVDDNKDMRNYLVKLLSPLYEVEAVSNGAEALFVVEKRPPSLIISDIMMPIIDGIELLNKLRHDAHFSTVPLIFLSARAGEEERIKGLQTGADDYIIKPFSGRELKARVKAVLDLASLRHQELITKLSKQVKEQTLLLQASNKELQSFAYSVSHDLTAPLRAIDGFSKFLQDAYAEKLDDGGKKLINNIRRGSQTMTHLIQAMLSLTRVSNQELYFENNVNLSGMAQTILQTLQNQESERKVTYDIEPGLIVKGDLLLLELALQSLLENAWKFTSKNPNAHIKFSQFEQDDEVVYVIKDNGVGFDMRYVNKLFTVFQRLHNMADFPGTGVGLAIVARIIQRHGGRTWAESTEGEGAAFYFTLNTMSVDRHSQ